MNNAVKLSMLALTAASGLAAAPAFSANDSPWMVRARLLGVLPSESANVSIGGDVEIDNSFVPEVDVTYFFSKNWAAELIAATTPHDVDSTVAGHLGDVWLLPPTLTLQYHLDPDSDSFRPYAGIGINYTIFYGQDDAAGFSLDYDNSFGVAFQAGADFPIGNGWSFNIDVKKIYINTDVSINAGAVTADVDINPWVVGAGFGYRY